MSIYIYIHTHLKHPEALALEALSHKRGLNLGDSLGALGILGGLKEGPKQFLSGSYYPDPREDPKSRSLYGVPIKYP